MAKADSITPEMLRELLTYDPETGKLYWKERPLNMFPSDRTGKSWNTKYAGREACVAICRAGYKYGTIFDRSHYAHRVAWAIYYGAMPKGEVDHINAVRVDNRIVNLRDVTSSENKWNSSIQRNNTIGIKGIYWDKDRGKWRAQLSKHGKRVFSGRFNSLEEAEEAYTEAAKKHHGEFARTE